jgi:hypothetical protein
MLAGSQKAIDLAYRYKQKAPGLLRGLFAKYISKGYDFKKSNLGMILISERSYAQYVLHRQR